MMAQGVRVKSRRKPRAEWLALKPGAHEGYVDWERAEAIRRMVSDNVPTSRHHGAPKHGDALLAGLVRCRRCGRKLTRPLHRHEAQHPALRLSSGLLDNGEPRCIAFGGLRVDDAIESGAAAGRRARRDRGGCRSRGRDKPATRSGARGAVRDLEAARYAADRAFRQYDAADPANRLVAGELETRWNRALDPRRRGRGENRRT